MFNIKSYRDFVESKIVYIGTRKDSFRKEDILDFCCQWNKTATAYFGSSCTVKLQKVFGASITSKPSGMSINTFLLLEFGFKRCAVCADILNVDSFCKNMSEAIGYSSKCRDCTSEQRKLIAPEINALTAKRRATKKHAKPQWLSREQEQKMLSYYSEARKKSKETGIDYQVDHIVPLQGKNVCGLHVPWNLQVITADDNRRKVARLYE